MYNEEKLKVLAKKMREHNVRYNFPTKPKKKKKKEKK